VKIDFLALGALSQLQDALQLIEQRTGSYIDLSRVDFEDPAVYDMLHRADTIGVFQVESAAQIQTITRIKPRNLVDMAYEVAAVRPGVGANDGVTQFIRRRLGEPWDYDHPLERRALERTLGVILFQDQVNQVAIEVAGFGSLEADQLRRAFRRRNNTTLIDQYWVKFRDKSGEKGVSEDVAAKIFEKFNGQYMFPESHAFAFGVTAFHMTWLKHYYPLEFFVGLFNQQPMGFYNLETLKEDARRHGVRVFNPDINVSVEKCTIASRPPDSDGLAEQLDDGVLLGFLNIKGLGKAAAEAIVNARERGGPFADMADAMLRTGLQRETVEHLVLAGAFDSLASDRRYALWEVGLRYRPVPLGQGVASDGTREGFKPSPTTTSMSGEEQHVPMQSGFGTDGRAESSQGESLRTDGSAVRRQPPKPTPATNGKSQGNGKGKPYAWQAPLDLPVDQDMAELEPMTSWERMAGEYQTMRLYPEGHLMAHVRPNLAAHILPSDEIPHLKEGMEVWTAGLVVRRQRPSGKAVFITLEDEFGHIPLIVWPAVYAEYRLVLREPVLLVRGKISRREGTLNLVVEHAENLPSVRHTPKAMNFR
jgi:DNA polymerase III alpha subunit